MKWTFLITLLSLSAFASDDWKSLDDPYRKIEHYTFKNGLQLILSPAEKANTVHVSVEVDVGYAAEKEDELSAFHVLEHMLFRNQELEENMTYLQQVKEMGGKANGETAPYTTSYFARLPKSRGLYPLKMFYQMLFNHRFSEKNLDFAKNEVLLEIGEQRNFFEEFLNSISPKFFHLPDYWESEFHVAPMNYDENDEKINSQKLSLEQIKKAYDIWYRPDIVTITVAGAFNPKEAKKYVAETFGSLPKREGPVVIFPDAELRQGPYIRSTRARDHASLSLGTKFFKTSLKEALVLSIYFDFLSHRLMKEVRNLSGDTYTAYPIFSLKEHFGHAGVFLNVPKEKFSSYEKLVTDYYKKEAMQGEFTDEQFSQAMELYSRKYRLIGAGAGSALSLAKIHQMYFELEKKIVSPYQIYKDLEASEFREILVNLTNKGIDYRIHRKGPLFFKYDQLLMNIIFLVLTFVFCRSLLMKPFAHEKIRWVRKIKYTPGTQFFILIGISLTLSLLSLEGYILEGAFHYLGLERFYIINTYGKEILDLTLTLVTLFAVLSLIPRKLIIAEERIILKSLTYFSKSYPLSELKGVWLSSTWSVMPKVLKGMRLFHFGLFKPGLILTFGDGSQRFVYCKNPGQAKSELESFLKSTKAVRPTKLVLSNSALLEAKDAA